MYSKLLLVSLALVAASTAGPIDPKTDDVAKFFEVTQPESRIVGGEPAPEGSVTYMVALTVGVLIRSFSCGASLVSVRHVLTAAHCLDSVYAAGTLTTSLRGTVGTNVWNVGGVTFGFTHNATHPHYSRQLIKNDIAIIYIDGRVDLTPRIGQVTLDFNRVSAGTGTRVHGFGRIVAGGAIATQLMQLDNTALDNEYCQAEVNRFASLLNTNAPLIEGDIEVCTFHSVGRGTCNGDSGSALVRRSNGAQVGIVSWGFACALGAPDVFVRLENYRNWLLSVLV